MEDLKWRYLGKARLCESVLETVLFGKTIQYSLDHTGGLFLMLLVAVGISFVVLILEHVMYFVVLPRLQKMPQDSIWKNRNVEFFSQVGHVKSQIIRHARHSIYLSYHVYSESFYVLLFSIISEFIRFYQGVLCAFYRRTTEADRGHFTVKLLCFFTLLQNFHFCKIFTSTFYCTSDFFALLGFIVLLHFYTLL